MFGGCRENVLKDGTFPVRSFHNKGLNGFKSRKINVPYSCGAETGGLVYNSSLFFTLHVQLVLSEQNSVSVWKQYIIENVITP